MLQHALEGPGSRGDVIGLKVALMSGRCCSEVFSKLLLQCVGGGGDQVVLRRCAASLGLDPYYVESSAASSLERKALKHMKHEGKNWPRNKNPSSGLSCQCCRSFAFSSCSPLSGHGSLDFSLCVDGPGLCKHSSVKHDSMSAKSPP